METTSPPLSERLLRFTASVLYRSWSGTWRVRRINRPLVADRGPVLWAHWHGDELVLAATEAESRSALLSSYSRDGERMAYLLKKLGYRVARGSSSRGGAGGLKALIDYVRREKTHAALAVDGPRGPAQEAKAGIVKLSQGTGAPIIPIGAAAKHKYIFQKAWNRCYLPFPFSECVVAYGEPLYVPADLPPEEIVQWRRKITEAITATRSLAEAEFAVKVLLPVTNGL